MMAPWLEAVVAVLVIALIGVLLCRERRARRELAECRAQLHQLSECGRQFDTGDEIERFKPALDARPRHRSLPAEGRPLGDRA